MRDSACVFFLTVKELGGNTRLFFDTPWNRIDRRYGILTGKAAHLCVLSATSTISKIKYSPLADFFKSTETMDFAIPASRRIADLVSSGVITIGAHITRDGINVWARCVEPHPRLGLRTHESYTLEEIESHLSKVRADPPNIDKLNVIQSRERKSVTLAALGFKDLSDAVRFAKTSGIEYIERGGVTNKLPLDSLTSDDLLRSKKEVFARIASIIDHLGTPKCVARITTQRDTLTVDGATTLEEWWGKSTPLQKLNLVMRSKHLLKRGGGANAIDMFWLHKLEDLPCPFRNAEAQVGQKEEGHSAEEEINSSADTPTSAEGVALPW
jgi:hypothetical protein